MHISTLLSVQDKHSEFGIADTTWMLGSREIISIYLAHFDATSPKERKNQNIVVLDSFLNGGAIEKTTQEKRTEEAIAMTSPADSIKTQSASPTTLSSPQKVSVAGSPQADLDPDVLRALQAILDYNEYEATSHQQRWAISIPVLKDLLKQLGKATQPKIEAVLRAKSEVVNEHHRHYGLGQRHNRVHNGQSISDLIKL